MPDYDWVSIKRFKGIKQERIMSVLKKTSMILHRGEDFFTF